MPAVIKIELADSAFGIPSAIDGMYVEAFDHEAFNGRGDLVATPDKAKAMRFANIGEAMDFWKCQSAVKPFRPDGNPNRPLTAFTVSIENA